MTAATTPNGLFQWSHSRKRWLAIKNPDSPVMRSAVKILYYMGMREDGTTELVSIEDLKRAFPRFSAHFGGNGSVFFTRSPVGRSFDFSYNQKNRMGRVIVRKSIGFKADRVRHHIAAHIRDAIPYQACAFTGCKTNLEVDHKDGSKSDLRLNDTSQHSIDDFQLVNASMNKIKREKCKLCQSTKKRPDASEIGFSIGWWTGTETYKGDCTGCYWHDPIAFRSCFASSPKRVEEQGYVANLAQYKSKKVKK